jgi:hypothetical protein
VDPRWLLPILSALFLALASWRLVRSRWRIDPATKTWLWLGSLFALVSLWLLLRK